MNAKKNPSADIHQMRPLLFSISMVLSLSTVIMAFEWKTEKVNRSLTRTNFRSVDEILEIPPTDQPPPPPPARIQPVRITEIKNDEQILEDVKVNLDIEEFSEIPQVNVTVDPLPVEEEPGDEIFLIVEAPPSFSGGDEGLRKFVAKNLKYPSQARRMAIEGRVFVQCVIEKDGTVSNVRVIKGIGGGCDEEAVRVISMMPKWNPGKQRGHHVRVNMVFPLVFKI
jgi:protein TonB